MSIPFERLIGIHLAITRKSILGCGRHTMAVSMVSAEGTIDDADNYKRSMCIVLVILQYKPACAIEYFFVSAQQGSSAFLYSSHI